MAQRYGDRWEVISSLSEGGQARTFRVRDLQDNTEDWVLKRLKNNGRLGRFEEEIEALKAIASPRVPKVIDFSLDAPEPYLVMPFLGTPLRKVVEVENPNFDEVFNYLRDVVEAVVVAHERQIIHRDIKPDNVVIDDSTPHRRAYLIDFGICQFDKDGLFSTLVGEAFGNRSFAAPEAELGSSIEPTDRSDVYSLGKLLYWALSGGDFIQRERVTDGQMERISQPRGVERAYVERILKMTVRENVSERVRSHELLDMTEKYGALMRQGISLVGSKDALCDVCRQGSLKRMPNIRRLGFAAPGDVPGGVIWLRCEYCGHIRVHDTNGTGSERDGLWRS